MLYENWMLNEELEGEAGIAQFGDKASHMEWKMQRYLRKLLEAPTPAVPLPSPDDIISLFGWQDPTTGGMCLPRRSVAVDCLSYHRKSDPAWEKLVRITQATRAGLNEIKLEKDPAERARVNARRKARKVNAKRRKAGLPELPVVIAPKLKVEKTKKGSSPAVQQSTDPTIWTDENYFRQFDAAVDAVAGGGSSDSTENADTVETSEVTDTAISGNHLNTTVRKTVTLKWRSKTLRVFHINGGSKNV